MKSISFKKSQGEIFGIALMFVVIIIGILVYGKIQALHPNNNGNLETEGKYKVLAEGTLNSILKMSTGCEVERNKDRLVDLINYCIENSRSSYNDPSITCDVGNRGSCSYAIELLNESLFGFLNTSVLGPIPFKMISYLDADSESLLNFNLTNFGEFKYKNKILIENTHNPSFNGEISYRKAGYNRAPSGVMAWATAKRNIDFELYLYYR